MKKTSLTLFAILFCFLTVFASNDRNTRPVKDDKSRNERNDKNDRNNKNNHYNSSSQKKYNTTLSPSQFKNSRFIEASRWGNKNFIKGRSGSYDRRGDAHGARGIWPYAEYRLSGAPKDGEYTVTVYYSTEKRLLPNRPYILVGMNNQDPRTLNVKNTKSGSVKATFKLSSFGKDTPSVKLWLPSDGVQIEKIDIRRTPSSGGRK